MLCQLLPSYVPGVMHAVWPTNAEEKDEIVSNYKRRLSTIDCQHFAKGEGTCPFGTR